MGDGHLQKPPYWRIDYTSNSVEELERFNKVIFELFGLKGKIRDCKTNKYGTKNLGVNPKPLSRVLKLVGVPAGSKVSIEFLIPDWILNDKILFARFINRLFCCEGCVDLYSKCITLRMHKELNFIDNGLDFFKQIKNNLSLYFNIKTTNPFLDGKPTISKNGKQTKGIRLKIKNKDSLIKFNKYIGFENKDKKNKLNKIIF